MKIGMVTDSLGSLSFEGVLDAAGIRLRGHPESFRVDCAISCGGAVAEGLSLRPGSHPP